MTYKYILYLRSQTITQISPQTFLSKTNSYLSYLPFPNSSLLTSITTTLLLTFITFIFNYITFTNSYSFNTHFTFNYLYGK